MPVGSQNNPPFSVAGASFSFSYTRDQLISAALKDIHALAEGEQASSELQADAVNKLSAIVREMSVANKIHMWALKQSTLTLVANTFVYTTTNGLPGDISELTAVSYRDPSAQDHQVEVLDSTQWEGVVNKTENGEPREVFLTETSVIGNQTLYVTPMLSVVNTQSTVIGSDGLKYQCIKSHTADTTNKPITGANYLLFWVQAGTAGSAWVSGTGYLAPQLLRLWYQRPLYEFTAATDNPDMPQEWQRYLEYRLAYDMAPQVALPVIERQMLMAMYREAWDMIFRKGTSQLTRYIIRFLIFEYAQTMSKSWSHRALQRER